MAKEKSEKNKLKRLKNQYFRMGGNERKQDGFLGRINTLKNTK